MGDAALLSTSTRGARRGCGCALWVTVGVLHLLQGPNLELACVFGQSFTSLSVSPCYTLRCTPQPLQGRQGRILLSCCHRCYVLINLCYRTAIVAGARSGPGARVLRRGTWADSRPRHAGLAAGRTLCHLVWRAAVVLGAQLARGGSGRTLEVALLTLALTLAP